VSVTDSERTPYERIGGDAGVRALTDRFYEYMDTLDSVREIRAMHPDDLADSRLKLYEFLSGWLGGPSLYIEKRGHPRLRARHMPFPVGDRAGDQWMECMYLALADCVDDEELREWLGGVFRQMATHLRNKRD
jgi:hemoglobin